MKNNSIESQVRKNTRNQYSVIYVIDEDTVTIKHDYCGYPFNIKTSNIEDQIITCKYCKIKKKKRYSLKKHYGNQYKLLDYDINSNDMYVRHRKCGTVIKATIIPITCKYCNRKRKLKQRIKKHYGSQYKLLDYDLESKEMTIIHNCGNEFKAKKFPITCKDCKAKKKIQAYVKRNYATKFKLLDYNPESKELLLIHNQCGTELLYPESELHYGITCPDCDINEIKNKLSYLFNGEYSLVDFKRNRLYIKIQHICGKIRTVDSRYLTDYENCESCKFRQDYYDKIHRKLGTDYTILSLYQPKYRKVILKHDICGTVYTVGRAAASNSNKNHGVCPICTIKNKPKTNEQFILDVYNAVGDEYTFIEDYIHSQTAIAIRHNICGFTYKARPSGFLEGAYRCPNCRRNN